MYDERDKSLRFSCIYNQAQIINADFGRLIGTMKSYEKEFFMASHFMFAFAGGLQWRWKEE